MKQGLFARVSIFKNATLAVTRMFDGKRKGARLAVLGLIAFVAGVLGLAQNPLAREVLPISAHRAVTFLRWWPMRSVQAQDGGGTTFTVFDAPNAGTGMLQGSMGTSINDSGDIAGMYFAADNSYHGFMRAGATSTITEFDVPGAPTTIGHRGTLPMSIDSGGDITGFYVDASDIRHGFVRLANGTFSAIDAPGAGTAPTQGTTALSINVAGDITGFFIDPSGTSHGFVRAASGTITAPLDAPGTGTGAGGKVSFSGTLPTSINDSEEICGVLADSTGAYHGFVYTAGSATPAFTTFDVPGAGRGGVIQGTAPASINSGADVSGVYADTSGVVHGFLRTGATGTITAPIDAPSPATTGMFSGTILISINATDEMTGTFEDTNGVFHAFLLTTTPLPPPAATPTFSPAPGTYTSAQSVTISDTTIGATIHYTIDGSTPSTSSPTFTSPIPVGSTETIKAIAAASGFSNSAVATATYTFNPDFQVTVNPTTLTIVAGQSGTATFTVSPVNGFNSAVSFACSGLPSEASCSFNPASVTPNGAAASSTLTVTTTAPSAALRWPIPTSQRPTYAILFLVLAVILGIVTRRRDAFCSLPLLATLILLTVATGLASCGGGNNSSSNPGTPLGTSTVAVSASTSGTGAINHSAALTITITH